MYMDYPTFEEIQRLKNTESGPTRPLLPLCRDILTDMDTPVSAYCKTALQPYSFLLESVTGGERVGRYSFIGIDPYLVITHHGETATLLKRTGQHGQPTSEEVPCHDPLQLIEQELGQFRLLSPTGISQNELPQFHG